MNGKKWILSGMLALALCAFASAAVPKRLVVALSGNPDTLDPQKTAGTLTFQVLKSVYDTLVEADPKGEIVPALAESWEVSKDGLTWTFKLRSGVRFHNGGALGSADVKATFDRVKAAATAAAKASEYSFAEVSAPSPLVVVFKLSSPQAPFLATLASGWSAILPKSLIDGNWDFGSKPVGTGPFVFKEWQRDSRIVLDANPAYWMKGYPKVAGVNFQIVPERAVQIQGLLTGAIDIVDGVDTTDLTLLSKSKDVRVDTSLSSMVLVLALNCSQPALQDYRIRQALSMAIDKQRVLDQVYGGGVVGGSFMDAGDSYYADFSKLLPYDPKAAAQRLKEAGWNPDTVLDLVLPQNYDAHVKAGQLYQEMLAMVGVKSTIRLVDWPTWLADVYKGGKYDMTVIGHTGKLDPDGRLGGYGTDKTYVRWVNPEAADLITRAKTETSFSARKALYYMAQGIMAREVPHVYIGTSNSLVATRAAVTGFVKTPKLDTYDFRWVEKR
jgi:peptide/nickel transport system substrate-binding protein